jgi:hypothetical protein
MSKYDRKVREQPKVSPIDILHHVDEFLGTAGDAAELRAHAGLAEGHADTLANIQAICIQYAAMYAGFLAPQAQEAEVPAVEAPAPVTEEAPKE